MFSSLEIISITFSLVVSRSMKNFRSHPSGPSSRKQCVEIPSECLDHVTDLVIHAPHDLGRSGDAIAFHDREQRFSFFP